MQLRNDITRLFWHVILSDKNRNLYAWLFDDNQEAISNEDILVRNTEIGIFLRMKQADKRL